MNIRDCLRHCRGVEQSPEKLPKKRPKIKSGGRLQYAKRLLATGIERGPVGLLNGKEWLRKVERDLAEAIKNNDFIYHERIPDEKALPAVAKAAVAKPTPLPDR